jgi:pyruvate ferredoxin oxidoreductase delta subunit
VIKPSLQNYVKPKCLCDYPVGPSFFAGHLVTTNSNYRVARPVVDTGKCAGCLHCYIGCPDGAIVKKGRWIEIDYDFCKGCGICFNECKTNAISMKTEE